MLFSRSAVLTPLHRVHTFSHLLLGFINSYPFHVNVLSLLLWFFSLFLHCTCLCLPLHYPFVFSLAFEYCFWVGFFFLLFFFSFGLKTFHTMQICILIYLRDHPTSYNPVLCCKRIELLFIHENRPFIITHMIPMWKWLPNPPNFWFPFHYF